MGVEGDHLYGDSMDRIECYLAGSLICSGYVTDKSDILCGFDDFEQVDHMFQTSLNAIHPVCENQLALARKIVSSKSPLYGPGKTK